MASKTPQETNLSLAEILSDLVSLRACSRESAIALVSARPNQAHPQTSKDMKLAEETEEQDVDIKRAKDLVGLHYGVREAYKRGDVGRELAEAREGVERALAGI